MCLLSPPLPSFSTTDNRHWDFGGKFSYWFDWASVTLYKQVKYWGRYSEVGTYSPLQVSTRLAIFIFCLMTLRLYVTCELTFTKFLLIWMIYFIHCNIISNSISISNCYVRIIELIGVLGMISLVYRFFNLCTFSLPSDSVNCTYM